MMTGDKRASFRKRTSIFLILMLFISCTGLALMSLSQDAISEASVKIREVLVPSGKLIENAKREMDLQIHELSLLDTFNAPHNSPLENQQRALLRLSPSIQALLSLHASPEFPKVFSRVFAPWTESVLLYKSKISEYKSFKEATNDLVILRDKTRLLQRAIDRELNVQLLNLDESTQRHMQFWILALVLSFIASTIFARLVWKWVSPLTELDTLLKGSLKKNELPQLPSFVGSGLSSAPSEILNLTETLRDHLMNFERQRKEHNIREERLSDADRSLSTLFAAISHLLRYNQELIDALIKKERLASMSEVAAQLAHEIRNPLNSMSLKLEMLKEELSQENAEVIDRVIDEIDRLDALTESHLSETRNYYKGSWPLLLKDTGSYSAGTLIDELKTLMSETFKKEKIDFDCKINPELLKQELQIPKSVLKSALINLIKNSQEAIASLGESNGKRIIEIEVIREVDQWKFQIKDTGCGFPKAFKNDPIKIFRTSKEHGSGLGLVTAQKMLDAYKGKLALLTPTSPFSTMWEIQITEPSVAEHKAHSAKTLSRIGDLS